MGTSETANDGILLHGTNSVSLSDITDGASKTILMGERGIPNDLYYGWPYCGSGQPPNSTGWGDNLCSTELGLAAGRPDGNDNLHFWSYHPGMANFLFADGSVRPLSYDLDNTVFQALGTRAGNEIFVLP